MISKDLKLGPDGYKNIAILGTAGSSMGLAPFGDSSWAIWACSPGTYPICAKNRSDVFFEAHRWMPTPPGKFGAPGTKPWFSPEFHTFLQEHKGPVFMSKVEPLIPHSVRIPFEALIEKHGPYVWTSSVAYMLALAIEVLAPRAANGEQVSLGLFGIDMSASEEYAYQRPACQHFVGMAMALGINVALPPESDLMRPTTMYGIGELNPRHIRMAARLAEVEAAIAQHSQTRDQATQHILSLAGAKAEINYWMQTWSDDIQPDPKQAVLLSGAYLKPKGSLLPDSTGAEVVDLGGAKTA